MKQKKQAKNWYVAFTHYLTAGFVVPTLLGLLLTLIPRILSLGIVIYSILSIIVSVLAVWLGVMYSSRYISKTYIVDNSKKVVKLATIYMFVIPLVFWAILITQINSQGYLSVMATMIVANAFVHFSRLIIRGILFYVFSRIYLNRGTKSIPTNTDTSIAE